MREIVSEDLITHKGDTLMQQGENWLFIGYKHFKEEQMI